jgi:predicted RND superfamily exporter protein
VAVDDTMHFLSRLKESLAAGIDMGTAVEDALCDTPPPILMTSLAVSGGFLLLAASQFQILVLVGVMTAVSTVAAVAADVFALPSLIAVLSRSTSGRDA